MADPHDPKPQPLDSERATTIAQRLAIADAMQPLCHELMRVELEQGPDAEAAHAIANALDALREGAPR